MFNLFDLELRMRERSREVEREAQRGSLACPARERSALRNVPRGHRAVRVRLGLALIRLGARLMA